MIRATSFIPVFTDQGEAASAVLRPTQEDLIDGNISPAECRGRASHVQQPDSVGLFRDVISQFCFILAESLYPFAQGEFIVFAEILDVTHLESGCLCGIHRFGKGDEPSIGENVAINEGVFAGRRQRGPRDTVIEEYSTRTQESANALKVEWQALQPHMLKHPDAGNFVKGAFEVTTIPVVAQFDCA